MYPDNTPQPQPPQQQQPEYSIEYLNQISGDTTPQSTGPSKIVMMIAGAVGLIAIIFFAFIIFSGGPSASDKATNVYLRLKTLQNLASQEQKTLRNNDLRAINSGLSLQLTNAISDMEAPLASLGVTPKKISKSQVATEKTYQTTLQSEFEDATLNVQLDNTYAREMSYQLETLHSMMLSTYKATNSKALKDSLNSTDKQLAPFIEKLSTFSN